MMRSVPNHAQYSAHAFLAHGFWAVWGFGLRRFSLWFFAAVLFASLVMAQSNQAQSNQAQSNQAQASNPGEPRVTSLRVGNHPDKIRVVLDITGAVDYRYFVLENPYRIVVDTTKVSWDLPAQTQSTNRGVLQAYRYGLYQPEVSRLVLDLSEPAIIKSVDLIAPRDGFAWRLVLDLVPTTPEVFTAEVTRTADQIGQLARLQPRAVSPQAEQQPQPSVSQTEPKVPAQVAPVDDRWIVVLDAGHGGVDPGAITPNGYYEKDIVLAVALKTRDRLEQTGKFRVIMTRDTDIYIPLRERVQIAQDAGADLFISLHADSFRDGSVSGASVFTLSNTASDKEAEELAARENKSDIIAGVSLDGYSEEINNILIDLAQRDTMNRSVAFARDLIPQLGKAIEMRRHPRRAAGFVVLKAPDVPSVLVELGFLSNAADEAFLLGRQGQESLAQSLTNGVLGHFYGQEF